MSDETKRLLEADEIVLDHLEQRNKGAEMVHVPQAPAEPEPAVLELDWIIAKGWVQHGIENWLDEDAARLVSFNIKDVSAYERINHARVKALRVTLRMGITYVIFDSRMMRCSQEEMFDFMSKAK